MKVAGESQLGGVSSIGSERIHPRQDTGDRSFTREQPAGQQSRDCVHRAVVSGRSYRAEQGSVGMYGIFSHFW